MAFFCHLYAVSNLFQSLRQLVGTTGGLVSAAYAIEAGDDIAHRHTLHKSADALQVAMATAKKKEIMNMVLLVDIEINLNRACSLWKIGVM